MVQRDVALILLSFGGPTDLLFRTYLFSARERLHHTYFRAHGERPQGMAVALERLDRHFGNFRRRADQVACLHVGGGELPPQLVGVTGQGEAGRPHGVVVDAQHLLDELLVLGPVLWNAQRVDPPELLLAATADPCKKQV